VDIGDRNPGLLQEKHEAVILVRVYEVEQVMRDRVALIGSRLACTDVEMAIDLATVGVYDLAVKFPRRLNGKIAFADRRRPQDGQQFLQ